MRTSPVFLLVVTVVLAGCLGGFDPASVFSGPQTITAPCDAEATTSGSADDPGSDVLGWEAGVWYDESLGVDPSDGLTCGELELVVARTMARVEQIRRLEFQSMPNVTVVPEQAFREQLTGGDRSVPENRRAFANARYEAVFLVNESADALAVERRNRGQSVAAFYAPGRDTVVVPVADVSNPRIRSGLLAHELVHALQDQQFSEVSFPGVADTGNAHRGVTEGDASYVQHIYLQRCRGPWLGTCTMPDDRGERSGGGPGLANVGMYVLSYQPYSDGPAFVKHVRQRGGWDAVNDLYRNPPASTEQTIHPALYPEEEPRRVRVRDTSSDRWNRVTVPDQPDYETWGEAGLFTMFLYPTFESDGEVHVVPEGSFTTPGNSSLDPYNYSFRASAGWAGDRLVVYRDGNGESAYVWKLAFDSDRDARQFLEAYRRVLEFRDARRVDGRPGVWRIPQGEPFADAFRVVRRGDTVVVVNAPTVDALDGVRADG